MIVYITKSNSTRILKKLDQNKINNLKGELFKTPIYFFSRYEKLQLLGLRELWKDPTKFIEDYYVKVHIIDTYKYVIEGKAPAYHSSPDCERLHSDYRNYEIPEEIQRRGYEEIRRFREWFKTNSYLLDKPDAFAARLNAAFGIVVNPKAIAIENSGLEEFNNLSLEEIEQRIDNLINDACQYINKADAVERRIINRFQKVTYRAHKPESLQDDSTPCTDEEIKRILCKFEKDFKNPVKELLKEYYRVLYNPELEFENTILDTLDFKPCRLCFGDSTNKGLESEKETGL